jgi:class 3 adenylate cyclase/tetratricopeptide (TPR) repeat protein
VVSVLFADMVGFTAASDGVDPEDVRRRVEPYHAVLREQVEGHGGRIEKLMGDGVLAVFGAPIAHEDDAERAVRAGLKIQEVIPSIAGPSGLQARVAVATGEAMVLVEGNTSGREGLIGDVVNTASRLQNEAPPGTVLVEEATHRATERAFRYEERPPVAVKGKREPLAVWIALEPTSRFGADIEDDGVVLVGRSSELTLIVDAFTRTVEDQTSQVLTIGGEPGVGKSRLVRELLRHIESLTDLIRWRQGRCLPYGEGITYWAIGEIVKAEAGILETDTPATSVGKLTASLEPLLADSDERAWVAGRLAPLVGSGQEATTEKVERFAAWNRYLAALAEQRPTVIVVEDLHWADPNLVEFLGSGAEATRDMPLFLVCTARPDFFESNPTWGSGTRNAVTVRLEPLDGESTKQLLEDLLVGEALSEKTLRLVLDRSGGNPLWAQEFVRMLHDRPTGEGDMAIPESVQAVVASRIDLLDADTKTVIQAASTVGKSFWTGAVSALLDDSAGVEASLSELARRELIRRERMSTVGGETEYAFTHTVVREVAYSQAPRSTRAERHFRVARWIEEMAGDRVADRAEVIAHHDAEALRLATATETPDVTRFVDSAIESHRRAAEQAKRLDLNAQRAHLEAALELTPEGDPRRARLLLAAGTAYWDLGLADASSKAYLEARDACDRLGDVEGWGDATTRLGGLAWLTGDASGSVTYLEEAIERLEALPPGPALASAYSRNAGRLWLRGDSVDEALELIDRVRPVVEAHGDAEARSRLLAAEGGARFDSGDPKAVEPFRQVLRTSIERDDTGAIVVDHLNLGEQLRTGWGFGEAISVHERGLEIAVQRRTAGSEQFLRESLARDLRDAGRWDEALAHLDAGLAIPERVPYMEGGFEAAKLLIEACRGRGLEDALSRSRDLVARAEELGDLQVIIPTYDETQWVAVMVGDDALGTDYARKIVERAGATRYLLDAFPMTMRLLRQAGELHRIGSLLPELRRFEMPRPQALIAAQQALMSEVDDPGAAISALVEAADALTELRVALDTVVVLAEAKRIADEIGDERSDSIAAKAQALMADAGADFMLEGLGLK